jgi:subtilisin-like proprotein convertase family protein
MSTTIQSINGSGAIAFSWPKAHVIHPQSAVKRKIIWIGALLLASLFFASGAFAQITVSGSLGSKDGTYASLTGAGTSPNAGGGVFAALNSVAQTGATITVSITGDVTEPGTNGLNAGAWTSITISPSGGAARTISGTVAGNPLINLNGADNVTFNGLNTGGNSLTITNLSTSATSGTSTFKYITDATNNTVTNCTVLGSSTTPVGTNGGTFWFAAGGVTVGNDNNTISNCNIGPNGSSLPTKHFYGNGSTTSTALGNSGISITGNNIFDYFGAATTSAGIYTAAGCNNWSITNNKFYQTAARTWTSGVQHSAIWILNSSATSGAQGFTITGNIIGYSSSSQTGTYALSGSSGIFQGILFNGISTGTTTTVSNNTIANISVTGVTTSGTSTSSPFVAMMLTEGNFISNGNTIGSQSATGSLVFTTTTTTGTDVYGIYNFSSNAWTSSNNNIGGITANNSGASGAFVLYGLRANTGTSVTWTAASNNIGGTVANSIQNNSTSTTAQTFGMFTGNAPCVFTSNVVRNITAAGGTGTGTSASVIGISNSGASSANHTISLNTISSLSNTNASAAVTVTGLMFGSSTGTNSINKNFIHSLSVVSSSASATVNGISINSGTATYANNMIRLGIDNAGASLTSGNVINGINETVAGTNNFYHNSVYVGGSGVGGTANTFAFNSTITTNTRNYRNNIFVNARSNGAGTGKHYGVQVGGAAANPAGLTINYNVFNVTGTGGVFGRFNATDVPNIATWRTNTGQDANSTTGDPQFVDATSGTPDLHINPSIATPVEAAGILIGTVTDDFDAQTRSGLTPTDIGADAGNFTPLPNCTGTPAAATINATASTLCSGTGTSLSLSTTYTDLGITYQWRSSTTSGGPYTTTLGTTNAQTTGNLTTTTYYICEITCTFSGLTFTTAEKAIVVNPLPTVSVSPGSSTYCSPGGTVVALTASGASTYAWSPATGLSATTGTSVNASPSATTTYTVTGTDANGCVSTSTATVTVAANPTGVTATATPSTICTGTTATLNGTGIIPFNASQYSFSSSTGNSLDPMTGATTIVASNTSSGGTGDDTPTGGQSIGFSFNYEGTNYTQYSVSPDGWILLGSATATSQFTNSVTSTSNVPKIYPAWDDWATGSNGNVKALVTGTAPNRILKIQWFVTIPRALSGSANSTFQLWLYETTNVIEFRYGTMGTPTDGASGGLTGTTATNYNSLTFSSNTTSTSSANNSNLSSPASGRMYTFTPPSLVTYAWSPAGLVVSPSNASTATTALTADQAYTLTVSNGGCSVVANTTVTVSSNPAITADPLNATVCAGINATFTVTATGAGLTYQWRKNGNPLSNGGNISGATLPTLTISNATAADIDNYDVVVSATCGTPVTSAAASLNVITPLAGISASNTTICAGQSTTLTENGGTATSWSWAPGGATTQAITVSPTTTTTYTVTATVNGCSTTASQIITVNPTPSAVTVSPASSTICVGGSQALTASGGNVPLNGTFTASSGAINLAIPDNISTGVNNAIAVSGVPGGATIDSVIVTYNITHAFAADVEVNLAAPNGQIVNLMADRGSSSALGFVNTRVSSVATATAFSSGSAPFTGTFKFDGTAQGSLIGSPAVTTSAFSSLFSVINGNWTIRAYDDANGDLGTLSNWSIKIVYSGTQQAAITWSPATGLSGTTGASVTASPTATTTYTATATLNGCTSDGSATVSIGTATITASAGTGGSISPAGATTIDCGTSQSYTITADACYSIADVLVDGVSQGAVSTYTFTNTAQGPHTIAATFSLNTYTITATAGTGGSISPSTGNVNCGSNATYTITADACYSIADVIVDGVSQGAIGTYTFTDVQAPHSISATFSLNTYAITVTAGSNGSISPSTGNVNCGSNATYTITADACYSIADVVVDGVSQGAIGTYTFTNVQAPHSISATFSLNTYAITVTAGSNGSISPSTGNVNCGSNATYTITADACYSIADVIVDGVSQGAIGTYTFTDVQAPHSISATFSLNTYAITVTAGSNGSISPSTGNVNCGSNATYTITPAACYNVADVIVDGVSQGAITTYTFNNVQAPHSISATFVAQSPLTAPVVSGPTNVCPFLGNSVQVTYTAVSAGATSFAWTVPANVNIISGQGTANLTVTFNAAFGTQANKQIKVIASSSCFTSTQTIYYLLVQFPSTPAPIVASTTNVCPSLGTNVPITFTIPKVAGATSYNWSAQLGTTTITHTNGLGANDTTITITFSNAFTSSNITVSSQNDCGVSGTRSITLTRSNPSVPSLISGPTNVCAFISPSVTAATYSVPAQPNVTTYTWTLPVGATSITGQGTNTISFIYPAGYTGGTISVIASNGCGTSGSRSLAISTLSPATPGVIDVINTAACPSRVYTYSVASMPANAASLQWTIPAAGTLVSGQGTTSITVSYPSTAVAGTVTVVAVNNCGNSVNRSVDVKLPACPPPSFTGNNPLSKVDGVIIADAFTVGLFPNPSADVVNVRISSLDKNTQVMIRVLNSKGQVLKLINTMPGTLKSFGSDLKPGTYMIEVLQGTHRSVQQWIKL